MVICPRCGRETPATTAHCEFCGAELVNHTPVGEPIPLAELAPYAPPQTPPRPRPAAASDDAALRLLIPIGRSAYAIAAGYAGLLSLGLCFLGPIAVLLGILAIHDLRRNPQLTGMPRAITGIILGVVGTLGLAAGVVAYVVSASR